MSTKNILTLTLSASQVREALSEYAEARTAVADDHVIVAAYEGPAIEVRINAKQAARARKAAAA